MARLIVLNPQRAICELLVRFTCAIYYGQTLCEARKCHSENVRLACDEVNSFVVVIRYQRIFLVRQVPNPH